MTADPQEGKSREEHIDRILQLEAERDDWESRKPKWWLYLACVGTLVTGGALVPSVRGVLLGLAIAGVFFAPVQLWVRRIRLRDVDRRLEVARGGEREPLPEGVRPGTAEGSPPQLRPGGG